MICIAVVGAFAGGYILVDYLFLSTPRAIAHIEGLGGSVVHDTGWGATVCEMIDLSGTNATDDDLKYVRQLSPAMGVYLVNTNITDAGLKYLQGLSLSEIDLTGTQVTKNGVDELRASIPGLNCRVKYHP